MDWKIINKYIVDIIYYWLINVVNFFFCVIPFIFRWSVVLRQAPRIHNMYYCILVKLLYGKTMNAVVNNTNMYECKYEYFNINNNTFCDRASIPIKHECFVFFLHL